MRREDSPTNLPPGLPFYETVHHQGGPCNQRPSRKFAISDLMILVAGSALGCGWTRANWQIAGEKLVLTTWTTWRTTWPITIQLPTPLLFSVGVAALACRFISPRPPIEQIARQPGIIALAVLSFVLSIHALILGIEFAYEIFFSGKPVEEVLTRAPFFLPDTTDLFSYQIIGAGPSVLVCWFIQIAIQRWEPERSWIDRTGRVLGVALLVVQFGWFLEWITSQV